ncbi:MAG TPA: hypothetical protein VJJ47_00525 [Candidatus Paceibacterota bacterium]
MRTFAIYGAMSFWAGPPPRHAERVVFHGRIDEGGGSLEDRYGLSTLRDVRLGEQVISFTKCYEGREEILYTLYLQEDGTWLGDYEGENVEGGRVRAVLVPVSPEFFLAEPLGKDTATLVVETLFPEAQLAPPRFSDDDD